MSRERGRRPSPGRWNEESPAQSMSHSSDRSRSRSPQGRGRPYPPQYGSGRGAPPQAHDYRGAPGYRGGPPPDHRGPPGGDYRGPPRGPPPGRGSYGGRGGYGGGRSYGGGREYSGGPSRERDRSEHSDTATSSSSGRSEDHPGPAKRPRTDGDRSGPRRDSDLAATVANLEDALAAERAAHETTKAKLNIVSEKVRSVADRSKTRGSTLVKLLAAVRRSEQAKAAVEAAQADLAASEEELKEATREATVMMEQEEQQFAQRDSGAQVTGIKQDDAKAEDQPAGQQARGDSIPPIDMVEGTGQQPSGAGPEAATAATNKWSFKFKLQP